jgi:hypothetical protein
LDKVPTRENFDNVIELMSSGCELLTINPDEFFDECTYLHSYQLQRESECSELLGFQTFSIVWYSKNLFLRDPTELVFPPHLRKKTDPVSETLCILVFRILDNGESLKTQ